MNNARRVLIVSAALILAALPACADGSFLDYYSPQLLSGGAGTATLEVPMGTVLRKEV